MPASSAGNSVASEGPSGIQPGAPSELPCSKRVLFRFLAIVMGLVAALILGEAILRVFHIRPARYNPPRWMVLDGVAFRPCNLWGSGRIKIPSRLADFGVDMGEYVPGAVFKVAYDDNPRGYFDRDNGVVMTINALGLRGEAVTAAKPAGTYRILGIGDSFTFGYGVKDDDTFLHRLQVHLNADLPGPTRYQVLNAGVGGYNTKHEVLYLEHRWLALDPDLVLIIFYINDAYNDRAILNNGQELGIFNNKPGGLAQYSYLWDLVQQRYNAYQASRAVAAYYNKSYFAKAETQLESPDTEEMDWTVCRGALERAAQITRERKIKLGLVMFPELYGLKGGYPFLEVHSLVRETCRRLNIPFLDLLDTFRGRAPAALWVHPSDHHPNERAHALAEEAIERFVREEFVKD
jgi:hypothetical protein